MEYSLHQTGRASIDFLIDLRLQSNRLEPLTDEFAKASGVLDESRLAAIDCEDMDAIQAHVAPVMHQSRKFRMLRLMRDWTLAQHGHIAMSTFEEIRGELEPQLRALQDGPTRITYAPDLDPPAYWDGYEFHRSAGGWDGHDFMGFVHGELIHSKMVDDTFANIIFKTRSDMARLSQLESPERILDLGCGSAQYTLGLADAYPEAQLWGCDLSPRQLEQAQRRANERGLSWNLFVAAAEDTGFEGEQFDLVTSYAMFHELPASVARAVIREAHRLLKPGGSLLIADVKAYHVQDLYSRWKADYWNQVHGGDPFWREYATTDFGALATDVGFDDAMWFGVGPGNYPFVLMARKANADSDRQPA